MSMAAYAIRTCLWRALLGKTYADRQVYDSNVAPIDEMLTDKPTPVITIATDNEEAEIDGHNYLEADRELSVVIEMAIASSMVDKVGITIAQTDEGLEMALNYMARQVMRVLQVDEDVWSDLFRSFCCNSIRYTSRRGADVEKGVRFAARQLVLTVRPLHEPPFGEEPVDEWARLVAAMRADTGLLDSYADGLAAEIKGVTIPSWAYIQSRLGLRRGALVGVGLGPLLPGEAPATFGEGVSTGDHLEMDEEL